MVDGVRGGGATRKARPWRPVKPLLTIWLEKARSVAQVEHLRVSGVERKREMSEGSVGEREVVDVVLGLRVKVELTAAVRLFMLGRPGVVWR